MSWKVGNEQGFSPSVIMTDDETQSIATVYGIPLHCHVSEIGDRKETIEAMGRARLIAAAPDLLEALQSLFNGSCYCNFNQNTHTHHARGCDLAFEAIEKATR